MPYTEAWVLKVMAQQSPETKARQQTLNRRQPKPRRPKVARPPWPGNAWMDAWRAQQRWVRPTCVHVWEPYGRGEQCACGMFRGGDPY